MKTTTIKSLLAVLALILVLSNVSAQNLVGTRIDLKQGSQTSDQLWLFSVSSCSRYYNKGWDEYKIFGSPAMAKIFAMEPDGNFQIDATDNINNSYIGFIAAKDSLYTLTFNHENLAPEYQKLYLIDLVENKLIDVYANGTQYSFTAANDTIVKRFKIVTSIPQTFTAPTASESATPSRLPAVGVASGGKGTAYINEIKEIEVYSTQKTIVIKNRGTEHGKLSLYNANSGVLVKNANFEGGTTNIETNQLAGAYVVYVVTQNEELSKTVILR